MPTWQNKKKQILLEFKEQVIRALNMKERDT